MNILEGIQKYGLEYFGRYYSIYRGIVVDNDCNDGTHDHLNYLKVYIPSIHDGVRVWARPKAVIGGLVSGAKFITPKKGDTVFVEFEQGDPYKALWSYHSWNINEVPEELQSNDKLGLVTPKGHSVTFNEAEDKFEFQLVEGTSIIIEKEKVTLATKEDKAKVTIDNGVITIENSDGAKVKLDGQKVEVNGGSNKEVVNITPLKQCLNDISKALETMKAYFGGLVLDPNTGKVTAPLPLPSTVTVPDLGDGNFTH